MPRSQLRQLPLENIADLPTRQSLQWISDFLGPIQILNASFNLFQLTFKSNITAQKIPHNLGFLPLDIIQTSLTGTGSITFLQKNFTDQNFVITTAGTSSSDPLQVRFLAGRIE